jgi:hypothetical protein
MQLYRTTRDLHLYAGLFISPFVVVFALSVFFVNHPGPAGADPDTGSRPAQTFSNISVPIGFADAERMEQAQLARQVMRQLGVTGEVMFTRPNESPQSFRIDVMKPGQATRIDLDLAAKSATVRQAEASIPSIFVYLHKSPGPHNPGVRGNWIYTRWWRFAADSVVYLLLFVSISGIYLWAVLKSERRLGLLFLGAGVVSCVAMIFGLCRA